MKTSVFFSVLNKTTLTAENRSKVLHNFFLQDISIFNELVTENDLVKKTTPFFAFMEVVQLPHNQVLVLEDNFSPQSS